ncbi:FAD-dependent oxidoreductase [Pseudochelatococcus lubricantis]|uniref:oxidoreductase n=1 Tax=Pseudochelatococcus lubricantis TaxID=1538102 RepID=UPI0035ECC2C5
MQQQERAEDPEKVDAYPALFSPIKLAEHSVRNRIFHTSINTHFSDTPATHDRQINYLRNRALGGCGAIVSEPLAFGPHQPATRLRIYDDVMQDYGKRWAEAVETHGCRLIGQIQDAGRGRHRAGRNYNAIGPAFLPDDISYTVPRAMSHDDIRRFIDQAAEGTRRLMRWGFSGVEISAGHGHIFHQFMSPQSNNRDDDYGGSHENRLRFVRELCEALRDALGSGNILGIKLPGDDGVPGGITPELAMDIARDLSAAVQLDYIAYAQGAHHRTLEMHIPNDFYPRVPYRSLVQRLAGATPDVPVMAIGRITDPAEAEGLLQAGGIDLIGLGRPLITDPGWPMKARSGRARDIRYCLNHNTCWEIAVERHVFVCDNNPRLGCADEVDFRPQPVAEDKRRKVVIVGAGVAGLEAAWVAAARGHDVSVIGMSSEVGGKARLAAMMPRSESLSSVYDYQVVECERFGVHFELGRVADEKMVLDHHPDTVLLATGSTMIWPQCLPAELEAEGYVSDLRTAMAEIVDLKQRQPGKAVILDMDQTDTVYACAERLNEVFEEVIILTPREKIGEDCAMTTRQTVLRRFHELGIRFHCLVEPLWNDRFVDEGVLEYASVFGGRAGEIADVAFFAYATPRRPNLDLAEPLKRKGVDVRLIGDSNVARQLAYATADGHKAGMSV